MRDDPAGHYATLGVDPAAPAEAITAAFRAAARRVHPDVPETGDAAAFMRVKAAYDVLGDAGQRAAYDSSALLPELPRPGPSVHETLVAAWRRPSALSLGLFAGGAACAALALVMGFAGLGPSAAPAPVYFPREVTGFAAPLRPFPPAPAPVEGIAGGYILPAGVPATLWRADQAKDRYVPAGDLAAFTPVAIRQVVAQHGMVEVRTPDGATGFVTASRLAPGGPAAAEQARCIYEAGPPPANNEVLSRGGNAGVLSVAVENRRDQPAVVKLRNAAGFTAASVFIAPRATISIDRLAPGAYRAEFAFGELWSRACRRFVAGMRAQRFAGFQRLDETHAAATRYTIPPADGIDEPDDAFNRD